MRVIGGLLLSAVFSGLALALILLNPLVAFASVPAVVVVAIVVGLPAYFLLRRVGWLTPIGCTLAGGAAAAPFVVAFSLGAHLLGVLVVAVGGFGGAVFWWAAVSESPDQRAGRS